MLVTVHRKRKPVHAARCALEKDSPEPYHVCDCGADPGLTHAEYVEMNKPPSK